MTFQEMIFELECFWSQKGCAILQPYDIEMGAGTFHPETVFRALGPQPFYGAFVQPSRRPGDGRYGDNPSRTSKFHQFQVIYKPSPANAQELTLQSLQALGLDMALHDMRFVEDNWESPTLGAAGLGWELWCDGMEILQFTYFQQMGGRTLNPVSLELAYGLERIALVLQKKNSFFDLAWSRNPDGSFMTYGDLFQRNENSLSIYNFEEARLEDLFKRFDMALVEGAALTKKATECPQERSADLYLPAYERCCHASHLFNLLDARGALSVAQRASFIKGVRDLARVCFDAYICHGNDAETSAPAQIGKEHSSG